MTTEQKKILALRTGTIAGLFTAIVCIVMLINFWQLRATSPLDNKTLELLTAQYQKDTSNEALIEEIRKIDLMARRAYFTRQWQIRTGAWLILAGSVVTILAFRAYTGYKQTMDRPEESDLGQEAVRMMSRRWLLYSTLGFFALALLAAWLSTDLITDLPAQTTSSVPETEEAVEEITIRPAADATAETVEEAAPVETTASESAGDRPETLEQPPVATAEETHEVTETAPQEPEKETWSSPSRAQLLRQFPAFRGPFGLGIARQESAPLDWDGATGKNVIWKAPIPLPGYNSPVIWDNRLFLSGADPQQQFVYCYDAGTGALLWSADVGEVPGAPSTVPDVTDDTGYAAPTVATNGHAVYAIFATGDVACFDMEGERLWARNLGLPDNHYGHSSSLLVWQNMLYVQFDTNDAGNVLALDAYTGDTVWETPRDTQISWASPILVPVGQSHQLILSSNPLVAGYDPRTGNELWSVDCMMGEVGPSPGYHDGVVYAANEYASLVAIRIGDSAEMLWETHEYLPEVASPVATGNVVYVATSYGVIACYSASDGGLLWEYEANSGFYASPMIAGNHVYFLDMDGIMHIFKTGEEKTLVGTPQLGESSVCTPAFADGRIFLRSKTFLYCIGDGSSS